jgi:beta-lactamase regulating signal transducer with metallopeptidase domain
VNELGAILPAVALRALVLGVVGAILCLATRRRGPAQAATLALATLTAMALIVAVAPSPWPQWWVVNPSELFATREIPPIPTPEPSPARIDPAPAIIESPAVAVPPISLDFPLPKVIPPVPSPTPEPRSRWSWSAWIAAIYLAGVAVALLRLALGVWGVKSLARRAKAIDEPAMLELVDALRNDLDIARPVETRESHEIGTPATVGWRRPVLLLPKDWRTWNEEERIAVLAHELAHVRNGDYAAVVWAQVCLALNFYQPLAYGLAHWLRLQQELAADAWGARLSGGSPSYLQTLARLALRRNDRVPAWPARAFLPIRGTLTRRIEMLRDAKVPADPSPRRWPLSVAVLCAAMLALAGVRGPSGGNGAIAQEALPLPKPPETPGKIDLSLVPADAGMIVVARPAELLARPELKPIVEMLGGTEGLVKRLGVRPEQIEQITMIWFRSTNGENPRPGPLPARVSAILVRGTEGIDWKPFIEKVVPNPEEQSHAGQTFFRNVQSPMTVAFSQLDSRTVAIGLNEAEMRRYLSGRLLPNPQHAWDDAWETVAKGPVALAVDSAFLAETFQRTFNGPDAPVFGMFSPLWLKAHSHALSLNLAKGMTLDYVAMGNSEEGAEQAAKTIEALLTLGNNALPGLKARMQNQGGPKAPAALLAIAGEVIHAAKVERSGKTVHLKSSTDADLAAIIKNVLIPAGQDARAAARRAASMNNMKQLMLAMHNYAQAHGDRFPPAVVIGPDGKTPHSWRVELLPYLGQAPLYNEYKMDEPWDSPANRKVLEACPKLFTFPGSEPGNTNSAYFALTGPETIMPSDGKGVEFREITDGTSNTIAFVEAQRDIPWTKPEDIPFDSKQPPPKLGGFFPEAAGFNVTLADGSVRFIKDSINPLMLRALITKAGGEVIARDAF